MGKKSEQGNILEIVIIGVLVLVIAGLVVWRFIGGDSEQEAQSNQNTTTSSAGDNSATSTDNVANTDVGYEGVQVTSNKGAFSILIPNGWKVANRLKDDFMDCGPTIDHISYDATKSPEITDVDGGGYGGYTQSFYVNVPDAPYSATGVAEDITLNDGTKAKKYHTVVEKGTALIPEGTLEDNYNTYAYVMAKGGVTVVAHFTIFDNTSYDRTLIDKVVKSIEIL